jgi:hypothetical protein
MRVRSQLHIAFSLKSFKMQIYAEKLVRLPTFFHSLSKQDILDIPVGDHPPIVARGHVTFGRCLLSPPSHSLSFLLLLFVSPEQL